MNYTPKQLEILRLIRTSQQERGYSPTYAEIAQEMNVSPVTIFEHIAALEKKGAIRRRKYEARSLEIADPQFDRTMTFEPRVETLPLVGRIAAGRGIEAISNPEDVALNNVFRGKGQTYMLQVVGDSMIEDHICDGDWVVVERRESAENGEVVVALINENDVTLKRIYRENGRVRLQPANSTMAPIYVDNVHIQGVVRGLVRRHF
jgi:repressor LexA